MSATLYEYAVLKNEKRNKDDEVVDDASIVVAPTTILARDEDQAYLVAGRAIPETAMTDIDRLVLVVRPF